MKASIDAIDEKIIELMQNRDLANYAKNSGLDKLT